MKELPAINISSDELRNKQERIQEGNSLEEVIRILGGKGYKKEHREKKIIIFWRFKILDAANLQDPYEIYMGEFEEDKLVFGAFLPHG